MRIQISKIQNEAGLFPLLRKTLRQLGLGKLFLKIQIHQLRAIGLKGLLEMSRTKGGYLRRILEAKPISAGAGAIEVHMLLNHKSIYEGLWSLYSFAYFSAQPCRIIIHDDGTLTKADALKLSNLFPQCQVIGRRFADSVVLDYFKREGLDRCAHLRQTWIYALKLFDPNFFSQSRYFILLDSDVLFFSCPKELIDGITSTGVDMKHLPNLYLLDNGYRYSLDPVELISLLGRDCLKRVNSGLLRVKRNILDFQKIEQYLQHPNFRNQYGAWHFYVELTIWAMELTRAGAFPLPNNYAICADPDNPDTVCGHFCGGGYHETWFYSKGLSRLAPILVR